MCFNSTSARCLLRPTVCLACVVEQWCYPLTLQPEQLDGVDLIPGRAPPLERHDKLSRSRSGLLPAIPAIDA